MSLFSPKQVAHAIGVSEATLKRWCDRGLVEASRTSGGHRRIHMKAVFELLKSTDNTLVHPDILGLPPNTGRKTSKLESVQENIRETLLRGDEDHFRGMVLDLYLSEVPLHVIFDQVIAPAFHEIGCAWSRNEVHVFQERLSCEICFRTLYELQTYVERENAQAPLALGATLSGDPYRLGVIMAEMALKSLGWRAVTIGVDLPGESLAEAIHHYHPKLFWLSVSAVADERQFLEAYELVLAACRRAGSWVVLGGRALTPALREKIEYTVFCDNVTHMVSFLKSVPGGAPMNAGRINILTHVQKLTD